MPKKKEKLAKVADIKSTVRLPEKVRDLNLTAVLAETELVDCVDAVFTLLKFDTFKV